jgi:hypothetical protein
VARRLHIPRWETEILLTERKISAENAPSQEGILPKKADEKWVPLTLG